MLRLLLALVLLALPSAAHAGASTWQDIAPGVAARLISDDHVVNGRTRAALEINLPPGFKTYWRVAGETGIPTQLDFSASSGITGTTIEWPSPEIDLAGGYRNYVYHGALIIPLQLSVEGASPVLAATVTMGICSDMCIPAQATFQLPLGSTADREQGLRLDVAEREVPIPWDGATPPLKGVRIDDGTLEIVGLDPAIAPESVIAELRDSPVLWDAPQKSPVGDLWTIRALGEWGSADLSGRTLDLTFVTPQGPYAATFAIAATK